ncbi:exonuclease RecJ [Haloarchaeobius sp. FL176]|uniref:exonuclease RecJ n=1 Tax=Haloarchaeobius sp. FL176 TaxID=2967129 RepID=UPI002147C09C|nr:exonuclease RecJ [Haloarchaeobius sp. FL176]
MSHTGRTADGDAGSASDVAAALAGAPFVHVVARADGDSLAAAGLVARALADDGTPFQVSVGRTVAERTGRAGTGDDRDGRTLVVGESDADAVHLDPSDEPASVAAWRLANELGGAPDAVLALAGAVAAGATPGAGATERLVDAAETTGRVVRRPGVALPTDDPTDVAHSTWLHGPFSAGVDAASALTDAAGDLGGDADESARRQFASLAAVETVTDDGATDRAGLAVERGLRPYATPDSPTASVAGLADLLSCTAATAPGTGVALALGHDVADAAIEAWRETAARAHEALATATTGRYDGLFVARVDDDAPAPVVARLLRDFRSPEPVALALADDAAAAAAVEDRGIGGAMARTVTRTGGSYDGTATTGYATYACETKEFIHAFREVL